MQRNSPRKRPVSSQNSQRSKPILLSKQHAQLVKELVESLLPNVEIFLFGSRSKGTARRYSDLDLILKGEGPLPHAKMEELRLLMSDSNLPMKTDLLDWHAVDPEFLKMIAHSVQKLG